MKDIKSFVNMDCVQGFVEQVFHEEVPVPLTSLRRGGLGVFPQEDAFTQALDQVGVFAFGQDSQQRVFRRKI